VTTLDEDVKNTTLICLCSLLSTTWRLFNYTGVYTSRVEVRLCN
jgi:hypothetical protein